MMKPLFKRYSWVDFLLRQISFVAFFITLISFCTSLARMVRIVLVLMQGKKVVGLNS